MNISEWNDAVNVVNPQGFGQFRRSHLNPCLTYQDTGTALFLAASELYRSETFTQYMAGDARKFDVYRTNEDGDEVLVVKGEHVLCAMAARSKNDYVCRKLFESAYKEHLAKLSREFIEERIKLHNFYFMPIEKGLKLEES